MNNQEPTETWKDVVGYEGLYMVSDKGRIKSLPRPSGRRGSIKKVYTNHQGYKFLSLYKGGSKTCRISRLVAQAFIPNPSNKPTVDHIDRKKNNNRVSNLRWATHPENAVNKEKRSILPKGVVRSKNGKRYVAVHSYKKVWKQIGTYDTVEQAAEAVRKIGIKNYGAFYHE